MIFGLVFLVVFTSAFQSGRKDASAGITAPPGLVSVIISANTEWKAVRAEFSGERYEKSPLGEYFRKDIKAQDGIFRPVLVFHGGWGKVSAAASTQYIIDRWKPAALINLGTCGGFMGAIERGTIVLVERTIIYDIIERMGDADDSINEMSTTIDLSWLKGPPPRHRPQQARFGRPGPRSRGGPPPSGEIRRGGRRLGIGRYRLCRRPQ